jgi:hypothetical protein
VRDFIVLSVCLLILAGFRWALLPHGRLPRFRVRYMRIRLRLRLHPGRGHATAGELWLRLGAAGGVPPVCPVALVAAGVAAAAPSGPAFGVPGQGAVPAWAACPGYW